MLEIRNLHATVEGREILNGIDLTIRPGEVTSMSIGTLANVQRGVYQ